MNSIEVVGVGKAYRSYPTKWGRAAEWMGMGQRHQLHWVLKDVNLDIAPGESVGLIGMNGAGKSTLLKIIADVTRPTAGTVHRTGRLAALLELGMGFHPEFPGRQNVFMAGQLQGLSAEVVAAHMEQIEEFAEIGDYIDEPVRTYSSGMQLRLAFSVATAVRPDILIVDEALAVGDIYFQQKCFERLARFRAQGTTLLLVSHSIATIVELCDRAVFLRGGTVAFDGSPKQATDMYQAEVLITLDKRHQEIEVAQSGPQAAAPGAHDLAQDDRGPAAAIGSLTSASATFLDARTYDDSGKETQTLFADTVAELRVRYRLNRRLEDPHVGFKIRNRFGAVLFETNSYCMKEAIGPREGGETLAASFRFTVLLAPGDYTVTVGLANRGFAEGSFEEALSYEHDVHAFSVVRLAGGLVWMGAINLRPELSIAP